MLRNKTKKRFALWAPLAVAVLAVVLFSKGALASTVITNEGTAHYTNESSTAMTPVTGSVDFTKKDNPVLTVVKTRDIATGMPGDTVTYTVTISYPQIGASAGDDSAAQNITFTDTIPTGMTFLGVADATLDGDVLSATNFASNQVRVPLGTIAEAGTARVIVFKVTVD